MATGGNHCQETVPEIPQPKIISLISLRHMQIEKKIDPNGFYVKYQNKTGSSCDFQPE